MILEKMNKITKNLFIKKKLSNQLETRQSCFGSFMNSFFLLLHFSASFLFSDNFLKSSTLAWTTTPPNLIRRSDWRQTSVIPETRLGRMPRILFPPWDICARVCFLFFQTIFVPCPVGTIDVPKGEKDIVFKKFFFSQI